MAESAYDPQAHRPRLLAAQCSTCIGRPGNLMHLRPGRVREMVTEASRQGCQGIICHQTLAGVAPDGYAPALCRWYWEHYRHLNNFMRVMDRLAHLTGTPSYIIVDPPEGAH